jgi:hypothetical protein
LFRHGLVLKDHCAVLAMGNKGEPSCEENDRRSAHYVPDRPPIGRRIVFVVFASLLLISSFYVETALIERRRR